MPTINEFQCFGVKQAGQVTVLELTGPKLLDPHQTIALRNEMGEYLDRHAPPRLVIDFGKVTHASTEVINCLLELRKRMGGQGLKLCAMNRQIRQAFRMLSLDGPVFEIRKSAEDAIAAFGD